MIGKKGNEGLSLCMPTGKAIKSLLFESPWSRWNVAIASGDRLDLRLLRGIG